MDMTDLRTVFENSSHHVAHDQAIVMCEYQGASVIRFQCAPDEDMEGKFNNVPRADLHRRDYIQEGDTINYVYGCIVPTDWKFTDSESRITLWQIHQGNKSIHKQQLIALFIENNKFRAYCADDDDGKVWLMDREIVKGVETVFNFHVYFHRQAGWVKLYRYNQLVAEHHGRTYYHDDTYPPYTKVGFYYGNYPRENDPHYLYVTQAT